MEKTVVESGVLAGMSILGSHSRMRLKYVTENVCRWIKRCGMVEGKVDDKGEMVEYGVRSHFTARSICNLHYLKDLEESRPEWPYPLEHSVRTAVDRNSFGF
jgi:hypothetical protein